MVQLKTSILKEMGKRQRYRLISMKLNVTSSAVLFFDTQWQTL